MMVTTACGQFKEYRGDLQLDTEDFTRSRFDGEIDVASVDTGNADRDQHLRKNDFFDVAHHPKISFRSTGIEAKGDGEYVVRGDITIRGVSQPIALDVEFHGTSKNPYGRPGRVATARAPSQISIIQQPTRTRAHARSQ